MKFLSYTFALLILIQVLYCNGGILIPEELQTILQLAYSYLPPIRTGTDSKLGVGIRIGRNADFQLVLELGPQITTTESSNRRRHITRKQRIAKSDGKNEVIKNTVPSNYESNITKGEPRGKSKTGFRHNNLAIAAMKNLNGSIYSSMENKSNGTKNVSTDDLPV